MIEGGVDCLLANGEIVASSPVSSFITSAIAAAAEGRIATTTTIRAINAQGAAIATVDVSIVPTAVVFALG